MELELFDRCRIARNRLRANAAYHRRMASSAKRYDVRIRREAKAEAYAAAARLVDRTIR